jgi:putative transposase
VQKVRSDSELAGKDSNFTMASFRNVYTSLMLVIAKSTDKELARQVSYLKAEKQILRSRFPSRVILTQREKTAWFDSPKTWGLH